MFRVPVYAVGYVMVFLTPWPTQVTSPTGMEVVRRRHPRLSPSSWVGHSSNKYWALVELYHNSSDTRGMNVNVGFASVAEMQVKR